MTSVQYSDANHIEITCLACRKPVSFSLMDITADAELLCTECGKKYTFNRALIEKISRFEKLLAAVYDARDLLGNANVGIYFNEQEVKVPYRLLLTRLNTMLTLSVGDKEMAFRFRIEPLNMTASENNSPAVKTDNS